MEWLCGFMVTALVHAVHSQGSPERREKGRREEIGEGEGEGRGGCRKDGGREGRGEGMG